MSWRHGPTPWEGAAAGTRRSGHTCTPLVLPADHAEVLLLFGGHDGHDVLHDSHAFLPRERRWRQLDPTGSFGVESGRGRKWSAWCVLWGEVNLTHSRSARHRCDGPPVAFYVSPRHQAEAEEERARNRTLMLAHRSHMLKPDLERYARPSPTHHSVARRAHGPSAPHARPLLQQHAPLHAGCHTPPEPRPCRLPQIGGFTHRSESPTFGHSFPSPGAPCFATYTARSLLGRTARAPPQDDFSPTAGTGPF